MKILKDKRFYKFLIPSAIGAFLFVTPINQGGNLTIPIAVVANMLLDFMGDSALTIIWALINISGIVTILHKIFSIGVLKSNPKLDNLFSVKGFWFVVRIIGLVFANMIYFNIGPDFIIGGATGGMVINDLIPILVCVFLLKFKWGAMGYIAAIIGADFLSVVFLSVITSVWRYFDISKLDKAVAKEMLKYCLPLIPASIAWWITNVSDRYLVAYFCGDTINGIYDISYKLPSIINVFATIFLEAWQISAVKESGANHTSRFFTNVFKAYQSVVFIGGAGIILLAKPLIRLLADEAYFEAWTFVPVLIMATIFACFSTFMTSIYMVGKRGGLNLATMSAGAVANIALNLLLIPKIGAQGASLATLASYALVFGLRAVNTRKFININISPIQLIINVALTGGMSYIMIAGIPHNFIISIVITLVIIAVNIKPLLGFALQLLKGLTKRKRGNA